ncbi:MAG: KH domain-containing protein, partial [Clostridia bacterium]|nr:KH domain-containing protein [Clostridia bacterium]
LEKEIPHGVATQTESFEEKDGVCEIAVVIVAEKQSHKGIIIGRQGALLKKVGTEARMEMEKLFGCRVFLTLYVRVKDDWRNSDFMLKEFGY